VILDVVGAVKIDVVLWLLSLYGCYLTIALALAVALPLLLLLCNYKLF